MSYKPSDLYISVIDLFAILLPGAGAAYLLAALPIRSEQLGLAPLGSPVARWLFFAGAAYVLGHMLSAVGGATLDPGYDRWYARRKRVRSRLVARFVEMKRRAAIRAANPGRAKLKRVERRWRVRVLNAACIKNRDGFFEPDPLLACARAIKRRELAAVAEPCGVDPDDVSNAFWWAGTEIRAAEMAGVAEVERLMADSKFFRGITLLLAALWLFFLARYLVWPLATPGRDAFDPIGAFALVVTFCLIPLCWWRFARLRWDGTERTYEYLLALDGARRRPPPGAPAGRV